MNNSVNARYFSDNNEKGDQNINVNNLNSYENS